MSSREQRRERSDSPEERPRRRRDTASDSDDGSGVEHRSHRRRHSGNDDRCSRRKGHGRESRGEDLPPQDDGREKYEGERSHSYRDQDGDDSTRERRRHRRRSRSRDRSRHRHHRSRSPQTKKRRRSHGASPPPSPPKRSRAPLASQDASFRGEQGADAPPEKQKPNFKPTGLLAKEANTVAGTTTVLKYHEPPEARKPPPKEQWRMYVFKKKDLLDTIYLHQRSVWLAGRDQKVTDLLLEHPSISKQHAVIQFRHITSTNAFGDKTSKVKPYLIDLESANGTKLNGKAVEASRFVEMVDGDVMAFGESEREYVLMLPPADA